MSNSMIFAKSSFGHTSKKFVVGEHHKSITYIHRPWTKPPASRSGWTMDRVHGPHDRPWIVGLMTLRALGSRKAQGVNKVQTFYKYPSWFVREECNKMEHFMFDKII